jgi:hypothetical protein
MTPTLGFFLGFPSFILGKSGIVSSLLTLATVPTTLPQLHPSLYTCCELPSASLHELQIKYYISCLIRRVVFLFNTSKWPQKSPWGWTLEGPILERFIVYNSN